MKDVTLLLVHGFPFERSMWYSTIASLGATARVLAPDLPGFGRNKTLPDRSPSLEAMADYLAACLDENNQWQVGIAGMSMGGYVALAFAEKYPERTLGVGLISSQAAADTDEARRARYETIRKVRTEGPRAITESLIPKLFSTPKAKAEGLEEFAIRGAEAAGVEGLCWALEAMAGRPDRTQFVQSLDIPVLIAHGTEDRIVPVTRARQLAESCRKPLLVEMQGIGHASPLEAPDRTAQALARWADACRAAEDQPGETRSVSPAAS